MTTFNYIERDFDDDETDLLEDETDGFGDSYSTLLIRPQLLKGVALPTIRSIEETVLICSQFGAVLTAGGDECLGIEQFPAQGCLNRIAISALWGEVEIDERTCSHVDPATCRLLGIDHGSRVVGFATGNLCG